MQRFQFDGRNRFGVHLGAIEMSRLPAASPPTANRATKYSLPVLLGDSKLLEACAN
jgi:hypothetical protein